MKTKLIQTGKATILVVDLPKGAKDIYLGNVDDFANDEDFHIVPNLNYTSSNGISHAIPLPEIKWSILGFADQLTEEQIINLYVIPNDLPRIYEFHYQHFFNSLLKSNGIVTVNPPIASIGEEFEQENTVEWQQAQQELWTNPVVLLKND